VEFGATLLNVVGIDLVDARIPMTEHPIPPGQTTLTYHVGSGPLRTASIDPGSYTPAEVTSALNGALEDGMTVVYDTVTQKMTFSAGGAAFTIYPTKSTLRHVIGMVTTRYKIEGTTYTPEGMVDTYGTKYILVRCMDTHDPSLSPHCHPGLGVIHTSTPHEFRPYPTHFFPLIKSKLSGLTIRLERDSGEEYDTGSINHVLLVRVYTLDSASIPVAAPNER
jgi:hypothetical protein